MKLCAERIASRCSSSVIVLFSKSISTKKWLSSSLISFFSCFPPLPKYHFNHFACPRSGIEISAQMRHFSKLLFLFLFILFAHFLFASYLYCSCTIPSLYLERFMYHFYLVSAMRTSVLSSITKNMLLLRHKFTAFQAVHHFCLFSIIEICSAILLSIASSTRFISSSISGIGVISS